MVFKFSPRFFYSCLSIVTFSLALFFSQFWWLVLPAIAFFLVSINCCEDFWSAVRVAWLIGFFKVMAATLWLWHSFPFVWIDVNEGYQVLFIGLFQFSISIISGLGLVIPAAAYFWLHQKKTAILTWPFFWLVGEILGPVLVSFFLLGPGSSINIGVGYGYAGLPLANSPLLLMTATLGGLYALTLVAAFLGLAIFLFIQREKRAYVAVLFCILFISGSLWVSGNRESSKEGLKILAVDTFFEGGDEKYLPGSVARRNELIKAVSAALSLNPDIMVLPEDSRLTRENGNFDETFSLLRSLHPNSQTLLIDSSRTDITDGNVVLRSYYYDLASDEVYLSDKQFLVPGGEYATYLMWLAGMFGGEEVTSHLKKERNYVPGPYKGFSHLPETIPALLFCYESVLPDAAFLIARETDAPVILHPISHSWFKNPWLMWRQLDLMLKTQAVWSGKPIISAGNMSPSRAYLPDGTIENGRLLDDQDYWRLIQYEF